MAMLQTVHQKEWAPRASSIYCRWIRDTRRPGASLVAVWIDSEMRCFEPDRQTELQRDALEDPGGAAVGSSRTNH